MGTGILAMPRAFANAGYIVGSVGIVLVGLTCAYCIRSLIVSEYELCKRKKSPSFDYPTTMKTALEEGPICLQRFSKYCP